MRWAVVLYLALPLAACRQTVVFVQTGIDGGPGGSAGSDGGPPTCTGVPTPFDLESPEIIVALDRSTGMSAARLGGTSVLAAVRQGLTESATRYQKVVRFGYVDFPGTSQVCTQCGSCAGTLSPPMANLEGFTFALQACEKFACPESEWRPTVAALARCADTFGRPEPINRFVLLITNGQPDCALGQSSACDVVQELTRDLYNQQEVATIVLAPGQLDQYAIACLQDVALSGGARSNFRPAATVTELSNEIEGITRQIATSACHLELMAPIQNESRAEVFWRNMPVPHSQDNGWDIVSNNGFEIELHGTWCDRLLDDGPAEFDVFTNCNARP
jgi:hypothetical protein